MVNHSHVYDSRRGHQGLIGGFRRIYEYRGLLGLLVLRDLTVRYKRSVIGVWWTLLNPILTTAIMWLVFSEVFRFVIPGNVSFVVYLLSGVLLISLFSQGVLSAGTSIGSASSLLSKVHVPAEIFPLSAVLSGGINFTIGYALLLALQMITGTGISPTALLIPFYTILLIAFTYGCGLIVAIAAVRFEDIVPTVSVILTALYYATPVFYPLNIVPESYLILLHMNPLVPYLDIFRDLSYGGGFGSISQWSVVLATSLGTLLFGMRLFTRSWSSTVVML